MGHKSNETQMEKQKKHREFGRKGKGGWWQVSTKIK
jgi:hypothetical protein